MSPTSHHPELDLLRRQVADLARELAERDRVLHEQTRHFEVAQALAHLGSWNWDIASGEVDWSDELYRIFGYEPRARAITFDSFVSAVLPDDHDRVLASIDDALAEAAAYDMECRIVRPDGDVRTIHCCGEVVRDSGGQPLRMSGTALDITDRKRTEAMLRTSQERLRQALRASGTGLWEWNTETNDVVFSEEWKYQLGYRPTEISDSFEAWTTRLHPEDRDAAMAYVRDYLSRREGDYRQEFRLKHKDGEYRWIEARASFVTEPDGRQIRLLGSHTDITDRKRMEESVRESEERYRTLVELSPSGVFVFSEGQTLYVNHTAAVLMGAKDTQEILDRPTFEFIHPDYHQEVLEKVKRLLSGGVSVHSAERIYLKMDGTSIPVQVEAARITWKGKPAILGLFSDITERKRMEEERQRTVTLLTNVINATPDLIFVKDRDLRTILCNNAYAQAVGKTPEEMIGHTSIENGWDAEWVRGDPDKGIRGFEADDRQALSGQIVHNHAVPANVKGEVRIFDTIKIPLRSETGEVMGVLGVARDITTRIAMEVELKQSEARLHEAQRIAQLGSWELDLTANRLSWSPETHRIFEINEDQFDASYETFLSAVHPDDRSAVRRAYADSVRDKTPCEIVHRLLLPDGRVKYVQEHCETIYDAQGAPQRSFGTVQDVTEPIRLTEREAARSEQLKRLSELGLTLSGDPAEIFKRIVRIIGELFKVRIVCLSEIVGQELHFKAVYINGQVVPNAGRCPLDVTPCATVEMDKDVRLYDGVMERFPQASFLQDHHAVSYCGFPSLDAYGQVVAVTCLLDDKPREYTQEDQELLRVFGQRIAVEVERARHLAERKAAEETLYRTSSMLTALIQSSPVGIITADTEGRLTSWNPAAERIFGWTEQEVLGGQAPYLSPEDQEEGQALWDLAIGGGNTRGLEIRRFRKDGSRIDIEFWGGALRDQAGTATGAFGVISDITERKRVEAALRESEDRYARATAIGKVGVWELDVVNGQYYADTNLKALFGYGPDELSTDPFVWLKLVHPDDQPIAMTNWELVQSGAADACHYELRMVKKDGSMVWTDVRCHSIRDQNGRLTHLIGATVDITERRQAEQALRESEERFSKAFRTSPHPIGITEVATGRCVEVNDACLQLFGFHREEVIGNTTLILGIWPNLEDRVRFIERLKAGEQVRNMEFVLKTKSGALRYLLASADLAELNGTLCIVTVANDITDRKQAEEALRVSEERFAKAFQASPHPVVISELDTGRVVDANDAACQLSGYRKEDGLGHTTLEIGLWPLAEERACFVEQLKSVGSVRDMEVTLRRGDGEIRQILLSSELIELNGRQCCVTVGDDITESKRLEKALRLTQFSVDQAVEAILWLDPNARIFSVNDTACRMLEYSREQLLGMTVHDIDPNFPVERWGHHWNTLKQQGALTFDAKFWSRSGSVLETDATVNYLQYEGQEYGCMILRDIGERKRAEAELRRSHTFLRQVIDTDPDLIFAKDRNGRFTVANKAVADWYGTTVEELIGKSDAEFTANMDGVEFFRHNDLEVFNSGMDRFIPEERITDAEGKTRWLQTVKRPIYDDQGQVHMVLGAATDITERKRMEEILVQRERDLSAALQERERISQDLHDGILQSLYAVGLGLEACKSLISKRHDPVAKKFMATLDHAIGQLNQVMSEVRNFIAGLESQVLQGGDFSTALRTMVETMSISSSTRCRVRIDDEAARRLSTEQALHIINIVREGVSNALRHSRAKQITVSLRDLIRSDRLAVTDDGIGFSTRSVHGVGHGLVNMAARAQKVRGLFAIQSKPDKGTRISLDLPKDTHYAHN
ncbi:MAG: PAS domain S-box protein [Nitrospirota bacterium]